MKPRVKNKSKVKSVQKPQLKRYGTLPYWCLFIAIIAVFVGLAYYQYQQFLLKKYFHSIGMTQYQDGLMAVEANYGKEIEKYAKSHNLNPSYFKALAMLECSGRKKVPSRYEPHIYSRLNNLKKGKIKIYEGVKKSHIANLDDVTIKNLASSWGPFQLLGYQVIQIDIHLADIRGNQSVKYSMQWINKEYGHLIRQKRYKDAFHRHNAGSNYPSFGPPRTYDPQYVNKGLKFMEYFDKQVKK